MMYCDFAHFTAEYSVNDIIVQSFGNTLYTSVYVPSFDGCPRLDKGGVTAAKTSLIEMTQQLVLVFACAYRTDDEQSAFMVAIVKSQRKRL